MVFGSASFPRLSQLYSGAGAGAGLAGDATGTMGSVSEQEEGKAAMTFTVGTSGPELEALPKKPSIAPELEESSEVDGTRSCSCLIRG